jgi:cell division septation protein DedD
MQVETALLPEHAAKVIIRAAPKPMIAPVIITKSADLEKDLSAAINKPRQTSVKQVNTPDAYRVQVAVFASPVAANRYQKLLTAAGFPAVIIKLNKAGKTLYRVQVGPLADKDEAKLMQQQLLTKGYHGIIQKG